MSAFILDGKKLASKCNEVTAKKADEFLSMYGRKPKITLIEVGENQESSSHVRRKKKLAESLGIDVQVIRLEESISVENLKEKITLLASDDTVDAILLQLPLPRALGGSEVEQRLLAMIPPVKDVDGLHPHNIALLNSGVENGIIPCTPLGIIHLIEHAFLSVDSLNSIKTDNPFSGLNAVVIGRSLLIGAPTARLLENRKCNVTVCHTGTTKEELDDACRSADIIVSAAGSPRLVTKDMVSSHAVVIDVGMTYLDTGEILGDVDFKTVEQKVSAITPMPGGVGPMTMAKLMENVVRCSTIRMKQ